MKHKLKPGDSVGLISCSDGRDELKHRVAIQKLKEKLSSWDLNPIEALTLYKDKNTPFSGHPQERAKELMSFFLNDNIKAIFDLSGGDSANQILPYLDFNLISLHPKPFFGLSDLTVILNALYHRGNITTYHFQLLSILNDPFQESIIKEFLFIPSSNFNITFNTHFLRGEELKGIVIGGNLRCFLKLAGTLYMPNPSGKILFLESLGGSPTRIASYLAQLDQMGVFQSIEGILLGTFTEMEKENYSPTVEELVLSITEPYNLPIIKTHQLGHEKGHILPIGERLQIKV